MTAWVHLGRGILSRTITVGWLFTIWPSCAWCQSQSIEPVAPPSSVLWRPYLAPDIPAVRLNDSDWVKDLIRGGNLYLTVQDAVALVLENNVDIEVARYGPMLAAWQQQRAEAGEPLPVSASAASLAASAAPGQGVTGSEVAGGVEATQGGVVSRNSAISSSGGPVVQNLDPILQESTVIGSSSSPEYDTQLSRNPELFSSMHAFTTRLEQGFLSGGSVSLAYTDHYLNENATTDLLNPSVAPNLSLSFHHQLLRGFGVPVNSRYITAAKINLGVSDLIFKLQVINAVAQTLELYYGLVAAREDVKAKQDALELAETLYEDNKKQAQVGTLTRLDVTSAEAFVASAKRALLLIQTAVQQMELEFKNLLSRTGLANPILRDVGIIPMDPIVISPNDDLPPLQTMVEQALANRPELALEKAQIETAEVLALGSRSEILPALQVFGGETDAGLAGTRRSVAIGHSAETLSPFFAGGTGTALGQVFRRDFPADQIGAALATPIFNRQAQGDYGVDQVTIRLAQLMNEKDINEVQVDLMGSIVNLQQARVRYGAAVKNRTLQEQLLASEQKKYAVGASTPYNVRLMQEGLTAAQDAEIVSLFAWRSALIALDVARGITLETNHVSIAEVKADSVSRPPITQRN